MWRMPKSKQIRGRRLKFSMANWNNRPPSFDLLREAIQGRPSLKWLLALRKGRPQREIGARVLQTWRNRHPGSVPIPAEFLRFHSTLKKTSLCTNSFEPDCGETGTESWRHWNRTRGTGMESNQNQVPFSPCSMDRRAKINFASGPPWDQKIEKIFRSCWTILRWSNGSRRKFTVCHWKK